jgi:hypothetical protein
MTDAPSPADPPAADTSQVPPDPEVRSGEPQPSHGPAVEIDELAEVLVALSDEKLDKAARRRLLARTSILLARSAKQAGAKAVTSGRWLGDLMVDIGPHIPIRSSATLTEHHHGLTGEALADALERNATNVTTGIGAAAGAVVAAQWIAAPILVVVPLEIVVETIAIAVVEIKLVGELHAAYGIEVPGNGAQRGRAFVGSWTTRRGVDPWRPWTIPAVLSLAGRAGVSRRIIGRVGRNLGTLAPLFIGAGYAARSNRIETKRLATGVRGDLRAIQRPALEPGPRELAITARPASGVTAPRRGLRWKQ